ncbi:hypothetical protein JT26_07925 [Porphyromonas sp. COT-108 OH1349]|nr:hypothetical protein JT26_07925 [Porphyromonas sp. COT-108 OH1349]
MLFLLSGGIKWSLSEAVAGVSFYIKMELEKRHKKNYFFNLNRMTKMRDSLNFLSDSLLWISLISEIFISRSVSGPVFALIGVNFNTVVCKQILMKFCDQKQQKKG